MKRFDLTFKGDILPHHDPDHVREGLADLFQIHDSLILDELFSGETFVLRGNLERKSAADYFRKLSDIGGVAELVPTIAPTSPAEAPSPQVMTRVPKEDPAAFIAARPARRGGVISDPPKRHSKATAPTPTPEPKPKPKPKPKPIAPSPQEILAKLHGLTLDAKTSHKSKLEQLNQMQDEVKGNNASALNTVRIEREEALLTAEDEFARLQKLETDSKEQLATTLSVINEEETAKQRKLQREIKQLDEQAAMALDRREDTTKQLELDRSACQQLARKTVEGLKAEIAAIEEQAQRDLREIDQLLEETEATFQQEHLRLETQSESLEMSYEQAISSLQVQRQEHEQQQASELSEIRHLHQLADRAREDRLTELWEQEEQLNNDANERLKQLEKTRARHQQSLDLRLQRFKQEEEKIKRGETFPS